MPRCVANVAIYVSQLVSPMGGEWCGWYQCGFQKGWIITTVGPLK